MPAPVKTQAVVLRSIRYGEADRIVHLYTPMRGRVGAIAKGARRAPSTLRGGRPPRRGRPRRGARGAVLPPRPPPARGPRRAAHGHGGGDRRGPRAAARGR